jgi:hypothetical protein
MTPSEGAAVEIVISHIASREPEAPAEVIRALHVLASADSSRPPGQWDEPPAMIQARTWRYLCLSIYVCTPPLSAPACVRHEVSVLA